MVRYTRSLVIQVQSPARRYINAAIRFCTNASYRGGVMLRLFRSGDLHQSTVLTWIDRYPEIFAACRDYFAGTADLRILSYGCATGEEVLTLRRYFPSATIVGAEINTGSLAVARRKIVDDRVVLIESDPGAIREHAPFDAVFCMAVLQRTPTLITGRNIQDLRAIYPFEKFDAKISELDSWLKPGGLLIMHHAQYALQRATVASRYHPLDTAIHILDKDPKFDRNSLRCDDVPHSIHVKAGGTRGPSRVS